MTTFSLISVTLSVATLIAWAYFLWSRRQYYRFAWQLRGPIGLPFIGMGLQMMNPATFLQFMEKTARSYTSPFVSWMGTNCFLYVNDPETVEAIFNSPHCKNKGTFYRFLASAIGDGLFTSSGQRWTEHRRLINPAFSRQIISDFVPIFNAETNALLCLLDPDGKDNIEQYESGVELYGVLKKTVLEIACQTTMGKKMNFQQNRSTAIFEAYNNLTETCVKRMLSPWLYPDCIYAHSSLQLRQQKVVRVLFEFVESLLQYSSSTNANGKEQNWRDKNRVGSETTTEDLRQRQHQKNTTKDCMKMDDADDVQAGTRTTIGKAIFIEQLRNCIERGQFTCTDVRDEANVIIAATFETTSTALYLVCLCLAMHPHYQDQLYDELLDVFPIQNDIDRTLDIKLSDLERLTFTEAVINEALRLFAPVPIVLRSVSDDFLLSSTTINSRIGGGVVVPRGTQIGIDIFNMQRSHQYWGPYAHEFRPDLHFGPLAEHHHHRHPFAFVPFTKGLRMCIGYRYALMLMKMTVAKIFRFYRLTTMARLEDLAVKGTISLKLHDYPLCEIKPR